MFPSAIYACVLLFQMCSFKIVLATEPVCSKFSYEEQLLEKMIRTEIKVETIDNEIKKTQDTVMNTLNDVKVTVVDITDTFEEMRNNITEWMERIDITDKFEEMRNNITEGMERNKITDKFEEMRKNITEWMERMSKNIEQEIENMKKPPVAFYANHVTDTSLGVTGKIIIFDQTITNEGSGYSTSTGIFTAPVEGLYQFTVHVCAYQKQHAYMGLMVAGNVVAKDKNHDNDYSTCSSFGAVARLKAGEQAWVTSALGGSAHNLYEDIYRSNTFSGVLIYH